MSDPQLPRMLDPDAVDAPIWVYDCPVCGRPASRAGRTVGAAETKVGNHCVGEDHQWWHHDLPEAVTG